MQTQTGDQRWMVSPVSYGNEAIWFSDNDPVHGQQPSNIAVPYFFGRCFFCKQLGHSEVVPPAPVLYL